MVLLDGADPRTIGIRAIRAPPALAGLVILLAAETEQDNSSNRTLTFTEPRFMVELDHA